MLTACTATLGAGLVAKDASACGMFVPSNIEDQVPRIAQEQVLLIYNRESQMQHFVREVNFDAANSEFGFIVPTPTQPEVAEAKSPFAALRDSYPFEPPSGGGRGGPPGSRGIAATEGSDGAVAVLSVQRVGKFTAFVLAASNGEALGKWLADNRFQVPAASRPWLDHYVALGFYYVAFRYDAPKKEKGAGLTSETVRISFKTPYPYYPYFEPSGDSRQGSRLMSLWFVSDAPRVPVAGHSRLGGTLRHLKPWRKGISYKASPKSLAPALGALAKLVPAKEKLVVQTFRDTKVRRDGFGDVLMVPASPEPLSAQQIADRRWLFPVLDPSLLPAGGRK